MTKTGSPIGDAPAADVYAARAKCPRWCNDHEEDTSEAHHHDGRPNHWHKQLRRFPSVDGGEYEVELAWFVPAGDPGGFSPVIYLGRRDEDDERWRAVHPDDGGIAVADARLVAECILEALESCGHMQPLEYVAMQIEAARLELVERREDRASTSASRLTEICQSTAPHDARREDRAS